MDLGEKYKIIVIFFYGCIRHGREMSPYQMRQDILIKDYDFYVSVRNYLQEKLSDEGNQ